MELLETVVVVIHVLVALGLVGMVLLQQGKGAEAGASFGSGASQTVFGSQGTGNFLTRTTAYLAVIFFVTSLSLAVLAKQKSVIIAEEALGSLPAEQQAPVTPATTAEPAQTEQAPADPSAPSTPVVPAEPTEQKAPELE